MPKPKKNADKAKSKAARIGNVRKRQKVVKITLAPTRQIKEE